MPHYPTLSLVLEYTPPRITPEVQLQVLREGAGFIRLEWPSHGESLDLLQSQNQLQSNGWTDVERFSGTGETLTKNLPISEPAAFFRLQREPR